MKQPRASGFRLGHDDIGKAVAGEIAIGDGTVLRFGRRHGVANRGSTICIRFGGSLGELRDFDHVRFFLDPSDTGFFVAKADRMQPVACGGDFEPPFLAKRRAFMLQAHQQRIAFGCGIEQISAAIGIEIGDAQPSAATFAKRVVLRISPLTGRFLQQHHQTCVGEQGDVIAAITVQIACGEHLRVIGGGVERELAFLGPGAFVALHAEHEFFIIGDEGAVLTLVTVPIADDER